MFSGLRTQEIIDPSSNNTSLQISYNIQGIDQYTNTSHLWISFIIFLVPNSLKITNYEMGILHTPCKSKYIVYMPKYTLQPFYNQTYSLNNAQNDLTHQIPKSFCIILQPMIKII